MEGMTAFVSIALLGGYLIAVRALRFRRMHSMLRQYKHYTQSSEALGEMTLDDAYRIQLALVELEFPTTFSVSIFFALFKTYGIPSISKLLASTGELSCDATASKRAADTGVLITEFVLNPPGSERNLAAIARMNWLHDMYRRSGKIRDDDMLYTLSLFTLEGMRWTRDLEWRELNDLERCAMAVYWRNMGEAMGISYEKLPSCASGWANGLEWLDELEAWSEEYEAECMVPSETNKTVAMATIDIGLTNVPTAFKPFGTEVASCLLSNRLRGAMLIDEPRPWIRKSLQAGIAIRRFILKHLMLPRPASWPMPWFSKADPRTGKYHFEQYIGKPWYIKPTFARRWNLNSWILWMVGGYVPSKSQTEYRPEGYTIQELGPVRFEGKGLEEMEGTKGTIRKIQGCPLYRDE